MGGVECRSENVLFLSPAKRVGVTLALGLMWPGPGVCGSGGMRRNWSGLKSREMNRPFLGFSNELE